MSLAKSKYKLSPIILAVVAVAVTSGVWFLHPKHNVDPSERVALPMLTAIQKLPFTQICRHSDHNSLDAVTPYYEAFYRAPVSTDTTSSITQIAHEYGYDLKPWRPVANDSEQYSPTTDFLKAQKDKTTLTISITRNAISYLNCSNDTTQLQPQVAGTDAIVSIDFSTVR